MRNSRTGTKCSLPPLELYLDIYPGSLQHTSWELDNRRVPTYHRDPRYMCLTQVLRREERKAWTLFANEIFQTQHACYVTDPFFLLSLDDHPLTTPAVSLEPPWKGVVFESVPVLPCERVAAAHQSWKDRPRIKCRSLPRRRPGPLCDASPSASKCTLPRLGPSLLASSAQI